LEKNVVKVVEYSLPRLLY